ncbi:hypothetical protein EVAR_32423_1 [Eumeta japonica]|uniref:Uncharacterized protein n=1 Tax=Eumeta variegata TaxID=151549 RepID=A0A4C1VLN9_EUMVA|nr:hypothetical protein EVAR_32423_1 [Eumeta japonica]
MGQSALSVEKDANRNLTINRKLTFTPHFAKVCKAAIIYKGIATEAKAIWGLSPERTIYIYIYISVTEQLGGERCLTLFSAALPLKDANHIAQSPSPALILLRLFHFYIRELDSHALNRLAVVGPHIYTDGRRIKGKVGVAVTDGETEGKPDIRCSYLIPSAQSFKRRWSRCKERYEG